MNKISGLLSAVVFTVSFSTPAAATLYDRGNGMVYDSDQDITWLMDANYAATQYAETNGVLGDEDGIMTWTDATAWVENLDHGGYDNWRLPAFTIPGDQLDTDYNIDGSTDHGYNVNTSHSEMAYLWHVLLGNIALYNTDGTENWEGGARNRPLEFPINTTADGVTFINFQWEQVYALGLIYEDDPQ